MVDNALIAALVIALIAAAPAPPCDGSRISA
jgi:hypothetical protein